MRSHVVALAALAALPWTVFAPAAARAQAPAKIEVRQDSQYGSHLTAGGRAVYLFTADRQGEGAAVAKSNCDGKCAEIWPPVTTSGDPQAGAQVQGALLGTIRRDGGDHVTYNGWPLYHFAKDDAPGAVTGHDKSGFGGEWYLVTPAGTKAGPGEAQGGGTRE